MCVRGGNGTNQCASEVEMEQTNVRQRWKWNKQRASEVEMEKTNVRQRWKWNKPMCVRGGNGTNNRGETVSGTIRIMILKKIKFSR